MRRASLALLVTVICWGAAFVAIRIALRSFAPTALVFWRIAIGAVLLLPFVIRKRWPRGRDLLLVTIVGMTGMCLYPLALSLGQRSVAAGTASFIVNLSPVFTAVLAGALLRERLTLLGWIGIAISFAGVALIAIQRGAGSGTPFGIAAVLIAAVLQAMQFTATKPLLRTYTAIEVTAFSVIIGTVADAIVLLVSRAPILSHDPRGIAAIVFLGVFPTVIGMITWSVALARIPTPVAASFLYLVPPVAIVMGWLLLDERLSALTITGGLVATAGVAVARRAAASL